MSGRNKRAALAGIAEARRERDARWARRLALENRMPHMGQYILEGREVTRAPFEEWAVWFEHCRKRIVEQTVVGARLVSTVFLGIDHRFPGMGEGAPLLFETMVFDGPGAGSDALFQARWSTYADAEAGHAYTVALVGSGAPLVWPDDAGADA